MISKRFKNDGVHSVHLHKESLKVKEQLLKSLEAGDYEYEECSCGVCDRISFELLFMKDRYGLPARHVMCNNCGLVQLHPRLKEKSYHSIYKKLYRKLVEHDDFSLEAFFEKGKSRGVEFLNNLSKMGFSLKDKFVLDVGAGVGGVLAPFSENGSKVMGLDFDERYIEYGKSRGIPFEKISIEDFFQSGEKADLIIYSHVLEHVVNPKKELQCCHKVLTKNGIMFVQVPGIKKKYSQKSPKSYDILKRLQIWHPFYYSANSFSNLVRSAGGFSILDIDDQITAVLQKSTVDPQTSGFPNDREEILHYLRKMELIFPFKRLCFGIKRLCFGIRQKLIRPFIS